MSYKSNTLHLFPENDFFIKEVLGDYFSGEYKGRGEFFPKERVDGFTVTIYD